MKELNENELFCLFFAKGISEKLSEQQRRLNFLEALKREPERVQGLVLIQYDKVLGLALERGIQPTFSKPEGLDALSVFLPEFFSTELAVLP